MINGIVLKKEGRGERNFSNQTELSSMPEEDKGIIKTQENLRQRRAKLRKLPHVPSFSL